MVLDLWFREAPAPVGGVAYYIIMVSTVQCSSAPEEHSGNKVQETSQSSSNPVKLAPDGSHRLDAAAVLDVAVQGRTATGPHPPARRKAD